MLILKKKLGHNVSGGLKKSLTDETCVQFKQRSITDLLIQYL